jgi:hypothetical protein
MRTPQRFLGRPFKPFHFALMLSLLVVAWHYSILHAGPGSALASELSGGFALAGAIMLFLGWWTQNDKIDRWALMIASGVWAGRAFLGFTDSSYGMTSAGAWLSICWFIASFGMWMHESSDMEVEHNKEQ